MTFSRILTNWYSEYKRNLPWRQTTDPYKIWLSEIILQQTQVIQGLPYFLHFIKRYPTVFDLANASENDILKSWQGLGYYSRARNLHKTANHVANKLKGIFPYTYKELIKLKGIGDYTASAIASICFNEPVAVVDGNVYRVLARYYGINTPINSTQGQREFKSLASELIDDRNPATHNQAIMEFGALQCKPSNPDCSVCPFNNSCIALQKGLVKNLPVKIRKPKIKKRYFNYLVLLDMDNKVSIEKRSGKGIWENMFQFPLIETVAEVTVEKLVNSPKFKKYVQNKSPIISLYNQKDIIHKLSHQHLYTKFWIIEDESNSEDRIGIDEIKNYPTPVLIDNFVNEFSSKL